MYWRPEGAAKETVWGRGIDWFVFVDGVIAEIRQYPPPLNDSPNTELVGFPYATRGYPT